MCATPTTDVLIAGGGVAGCSLAIMLSRKGLTVELFEKGEFPREKPCGEGLMPAGVAVLERLGLKAAVGGTPFYGVRYHFGDRVAEGRFPRVDGVPNAGCSQRRKVLDQILFSAAAGSPGVTAHTRARVDSPLLENGRAAGLVVDGWPVRAPLVVAADGVHSNIRRRLGLDRPARRRRFGMRAHFCLAPGMVLEPWVDVYMGRGYEVYVTPLPEREALVAVLSEAGPFGEPAAQEFDRRWRAIPRLAAQLNGARQVTTVMGMSPLAGSSRRGVAPGVVLLGDAAGFLDPITGGGMTQALVTAELLAEYIATHRGSGDDWLWSFERDRRALLRDYQMLTKMVLWTAGRPAVASALLTLFRRWPSLLSHCVGVSGGVKPLFG